MAEFAQEGLADILQIFHTRRSLSILGDCIFPRHFDKPLLIAVIEKTLVLPTMNALYNGILVEGRNLTCTLFLI